MYLSGKTDNSNFGHDKKALFFVVYQIKSLIGLFFATHCSAATLFSSSNKCHIEDTNELKLGLFWPAGLFQVQ